MIFRGDPGQALRDPRAREISDAEMRELMLANFKQYDYGQDTSPELPQRLVDAHFAVRSGTPALGFGAGEDGGLQSMCTLFLDPDVDGTRVAMVEQVGTFPPYRGRGLAKAVVSAAVRAGGEWGADLITVPADADDWPQLIYANLGFDPVGVQAQFTRRLRTGAAGTCETPQ
jgi:GNAT superfamily N-acetyltransferase